MEANSHFNQRDDEFKKLEREDEEDVVDKRILAIIGMLVVANYLNYMLDRKFKLAKYVQGEHGLAMIIGIMGGLIAKQYFDDIDIKDFLYEQALLFRLLLLPPIVYEV